MRKSFIYTVETNENNIEGPVQIRTFTMISLVKQYIETIKQLYSIVYAKELNVTGKIINHHWTDTPLIEGSLPMIIGNVVLSSVNKKGQIENFVKIKVTKKLACRGVCYG